MSVLNLLILCMDVVGSKRAACYESEATSVVASAGNVTVI